MPHRMWRYSSPAWTGRRVLRDVAPSLRRRSITTRIRRAFRAARCSGAGCPPVTIPGIGSQALGTPLMASTGGSLEWPRLGLAAQYYLKRPPWVAPPPLAPRPFEAASQAMAQLGRGVPDGAALLRFSRRSTAGHEPGGPAARSVGATTCLNRIRAMGAGTRCQGAGHHARRLAPWRRPPHARSPAARAAVRAVAAPKATAERGPFRKIVRR